jgi:hypothetical protein
LRLLTSIDAGLLHLFVSRPDRYPTWDEIHALQGLVQGPTTVSAVSAPGVREP